MIKITSEKKTQTIIESNNEYFEERKKNFKYRKTKLRCSKFWAKNKITNTQNS